MQPQLKLTALVAIAAALSVPVAHAADGSMKHGDPAAVHSSSDRMAAKQLNMGRDALVQNILKGHSVEAIRQKLADMGYQITAVNDVDDDYVEYEVVKGRDSYEVQIDLKDGTQMAEKVDIAPNLWRADSTKAAMRGDTYTMSRTGDYSDRTRMAAWSGEKDQLEKTLGTGHTAGQYRDQLQKMGYTVTSVNDRDTDYVEYEIVKGDNSYEVQLDLDGSGKATKVDVTTNVWESDATERALNKR
jgi:DNA-dependent RNA polymerase auxiliary subunit epsilon